MSNKYDWAAIKARVNIKDVIGKAVKLNRKGQGLCPFHGEKTPSFQVYDDNAHCFGCGWHGDVVDFVAAMDNCTPADAIAKLGAGDFELSGAEKQILADREKQKDADRREAIAKAQRRWENAKPASRTNGYLVRKEIGPGMARQEGDNLLLPVYDAQGEIQSVQTIAPDGAKLFQKDAPMKGGRLNFGIFLGRSIVCEGFATAASIYDAIPDRIVVAFSKSGVIDIVRELHGRGQEVVIASDRNALEAMLELSEELGVPVYAPPDPHDDFNDLAVAGGDVVSVFNGKPEAAPSDDTSKTMPFSVAGVDLTQPPGATGVLAEWMESRNRRPRQRLSVATSIYALSCIMGNHYRDVRDGVTANLFVVCIAGSRTGKEGLFQSLTQVLRTASLSAAMHGNIKSEQEIVRNLIDHQPAFYAIDEVGFTLRKIRNAQKGNGGASYLEAVIGVLMSAYSKASGYMPLSGDLMRAMRADFKAELARLEKDDSGEQWIEDRIAYVTGMLNSPEPGLKNPFLSLIGFTTAETFNEIVDFDMATNGFIGRSLLFSEPDTAPRSKQTKGFKAPDMPLGLKMQIMAIAGGERTSGGRIEYSDDDVIEVVTDDEADKMLEDALIWFEDQAVAHKSSSGLEALYLGSYELVAKISFILAAATRVRTAEHVRWAFELIRRDVGEKARMVMVNEKETSAPDIALKARIANLASGDGETMGVIYNRIPRRKREEIDAIVQSMKDAGLLEVVSVSKKGMEKIKYVGDG